MDFVCSKCGSRSFTVLHGDPMEVKCLSCGKVAPFSVAVGSAKITSELRGGQKPTKGEK